MEGYGEVGRAFVCVRFVMRMCGINFVGVAMGSGEGEVR